MLSKSKVFRKFHKSTFNYVTLSDGSPKNLQQLQLELAFLNERVKEIKNAIACFKDDSTKRVLFLGAGMIFHNFMLFYFFLSSQNFHRTFFNDRY